MTAALGVLASLAIVVALLLFAARAAQRFGFARGTGDAELRVLRRMPLGPRQGIAVVQIADRVLAVSVGDGGVRTVAELDHATAARFQAPPAPAAVPFRATLERALKGRVASAIIFACLTATALGLTASQATAQSGVQRVTLPAAGAQSTTPVAATQSGALSQAMSSAAPQVQLALGSGGQDGLKVTGAVGTVLVLGALTMLPAVLLLMTGFTRILIVLHLLRQALGTQTAPPGQLLTALALILTGFVMAPTMAQVNQTALSPWLDGQIDELTMVKTALVPLREFMIEQTPEQDVDHFVELSNADIAPGAEVPTTVLTAAFATSELRAAFKMGFAIFLPFVVIDLVVASVLSGMGMFMLPPAMIALPCKLLLFVLVDGWALTVQSLVRSFGA